MNQAEATQKLSAYDELHQKAAMETTDGIFLHALPVEDLLRSLQELRQLQQEIATALKDEQMNFDDGVLSEMNEVHAAFSKLPAYTQKATRLAQRMKIVADRIEKLKGRCGSIQLDAYKYSVSLKKDIAAANIRSTNPTVSRTTTTDVHNPSAVPNINQDATTTTSSAPTSSTIDS